MYFVSAIMPDHALSCPDSAAGADVLAGKFLSSSGQAWDGQAGKTRINLSNEHRNVPITYKTFFEQRVHRRSSTRRRKPSPISTLAVNQRASANRGVVLSLLPIALEKKP